MLLLLLPKKRFSSFAWISICSNLFRFEISDIYRKYTYSRTRTISFKWWVVSSFGEIGRRKKTKPKTKNQYTDISNLKRFEQIEFQAKLLNYFSGSNKSKINQFLTSSPWRPGCFSRTRQLKEWWQHALPPPTTAYLASLLTRTGIKSLIVRQEGSRPS